jgi:hypothetical protein
MEGEMQQVLGMTLQGQLTLLRSRGFILTVVHTDPLSAFCALTTQFPGVVIDIGGAGGKVDAKLQHIKELNQSVKAGLPWKLPPSLVKDLITFAVYQHTLQNIVEHKCIPEGTVNWLVPELQERVKALHLEIT